MAGKLYLVATPIGNLGDMTYRARETLERVDFIAAEDTRVTIKLLNHLGIKKAMVSYYEHNKEYSGEKIVSRIEGGESCALVTDAGTPAISDPGEDLVRLCVEKGIDVVSLPGPCAAVAALAASGLNTQRFCFEGFLSTSRRSRNEHLTSLVPERRTMVFYEAPHKLLATLRDMLARFGDREIVIARELTKFHEEIIRTTISGALALFEARQPKGEFVLLIRGAQAAEPEKVSLEEALRLVEKHQAAGLPLKEAARLVSKESGYSKNELYDMSVRRGDND